MMIPIKQQWHHVSMNGCHMDNAKMNGWICNEYYLGLRWFKMQGHSPRQDGKYSYTIWSWSKDKCWPR